MFSVRTLDLPLFPQDEDNGEYLIFLPGVPSTPASRVTFKVDHDNNELQIACFDDAEPDSEPAVRFSVAINESNRPFVDDIELLNIIHPDDIAVEQLTDDPDLQEEIQGLFDHIKAMESEAA